MNWFNSLQLMLLWAAIPYGLMLMDDNDVKYKGIAKCILIPLYLIGFISLTWLVSNKSGWF